MDTATSSKLSPDEESRVAPVCRAMQVVCMLLHALELSAASSFLLLRGIAYLKDTFTFNLADGSEPCTCGCNYVE